MNAPVTDDPRFDRLPKWVKDRLRARDERIERLEAELATTRALLSKDVSEDSPVVVDPFSANRRLLELDEHTPIEFRFKGEKHPDYWSYFHVTLRDRYLSVHASSGLVVKPQSGNSIEISLEER
jgi:hypothetical protein